jgi:hypothetical protein
MKKVSAKKVSVELNNMANNLNNNVRRVVKNDMAINLIRVLLIVYTSFVIPVLDSQTLDVLNNNVVRLVVCALIVYLAFMDVVTSVLLTVAFVLTIHHGKKRVQQVNNNSVNDVDSDMVNKINSLNDVRVENYEDLNNALNGNAVNGNAVNGNNLGNEENPFAPVESKPVPEPVVQPTVQEPELNIPEMQVNNAAPVESNNLLENNLMANVVSNNAVEDTNNLPAGLDNLPENNLAVFNNAANNVANNSNNNSIEARNEEHPASNTLTDNILNVAVGAEPDPNGPSGLTTWQQLYDASENAVPGADIMSQVKSVEEGHSAQGMNGPVGANYARHDGYPMTAGQHLVHNKLRNNAV